MKFFSLFSAFISLLVNTSAQADTLDKQSVGFRYTDNVYLTPESKTADSYLLVNSRFQFFMGERILRMKMDYADYSKESDNDYAGLTLTTKWGSVRSADLDLKLFHKNYVNENAATTDNSFTHTGAGAALEKSWTPNSNVLITGGTSYDTRFFHDFNGRNDHQLMLFGDLDFNSYSKVTPYIYADCGLVLSSLAAYSNVFFDIGGGAKGPLSKDLSWLVDLDLRSVSYSNRNVDETLILTKRRGSSQTTTVTNNEQTQTTTIGGGIRWGYDKNFEFESRVNSTAQSSNNPNFAYKNDEIYFSLSYIP
ncbi:hypothetical protein [Bdellovibrio sp. HCB337]|uniref:hypothetical protein n=1 Tax=Bdellovibrio sp. HCB337 TaxID=3394358 RepID=UPI0039A54AEA